MPTRDQERYLTGNQFLAIRADNERIAVALERIADALEGKESDGQPTEQGPNTHSTISG